MKVVTRKRAPLAVADELLRFAAEFNLAVPDYFLAISLAETGKRLVNLCVLKRLTIAGAESVTGGMIASRLTDTPGASGFFQGAAVIYTPEAKMSVLGVPAALISKRGVVSADVAREMAKRARMLFNADLAYATTGFAGPEGGSPDEPPIGTVYAAFAKGTMGSKKLEKPLVWRCDFKGASREAVRDMATEFVIRALLLLCLNDAAERTELSTGDEEG
jgi:nicotinamide-nucleotide amidase